MKKYVNRLLGLQDGREQKRRQRIKELEETSRAIQTIIESGYSSHFRIYQVNFIRGVFFGLGSVVGATVVVAAIAWLLSALGKVPLVDGLFDAVRNSLENR